MKFTAILLLAACLQVSARVSAQAITLKEKSATLEKVFKEIEKQSGYVFFFNYQWLERSKPVSVELKAIPLLQALDECFRDQPFTYAIVNKTIVVKQKEPSAKNADPAPAGPPPPTTIHGKVLNEKGEPVAGVTVTVKGTNNRTSTNDNGEFSLTVADANSTLVFTAITIETFETKLNGRTKLVLNAMTKVGELAGVEVVNKGYYTTTQRFNTGDVITVKGEDIAKQPVSNPLAALEGRVPGMVIQQGTGLFGGNFTVQIQGKNSISNGTLPLYVIDGVPYSSQLLGNGSTGGGSNNANPTGGNPLNFINPSDIDRIDILKDADATAIYGSRGANGVVLITTKKGKAGKVSINLNVQSGIGKTPFHVDYVNTQQYLQMRREAFRNDNVVPTTANAPDLLVWDTTRYTDWQQFLLGGTARYHDVQASVSGGNADVQYIVGGNYHRETTVFPGQNFDQRSSLDAKLSAASPDQKLRMQLSLNYAIDNIDRPIQDLTSLLGLLSPNAPALYNTDGSLNWAPVTPGTAGTFTLNPYSLLQQRYKGTTNNLVSNLVLSYAILPKLALKANLGYTNMTIAEKTIVPQSALDPGTNPVSGNTFFNNALIRSWLAEPQLNYTTHIGKGEFSALVGGTFQQNYSDAASFSASGFSSDIFLENIKNASSVTVTSVSNATYKYNAVYSRLNYNLQNRYLVNLTMRRDGTSRFGPDNRFANFGAIGAGWIFSEEKFFRDKHSILNFGKLRASYGTSGNDQVGDYTFMDLYSSFSGAYQSTQGLYPNRLTNPGLQWETTKKFGLGLDLNFFQDQLVLNVDYYRNRSSNQLLSYTLSAVTGFTFISTNFPATIQNAGLQVQLSTINIRHKNFTWSTSFNITTAQNKLVSFPGLATSSYASTLVIGKPITIVKRYQFAGVDPQSGRYQFRDAGGNLTFSPAAADKTAISNKGVPDYYGGMLNSFQYRGFSIDVFFQFVHQTGYPFLYNNLPGGKYNQPVSMLDHWRQPGDGTLYQLMSQNAAGAAATSNNLLSQSNLFDVDASFVRLKNLSISYAFPTAWVRKRQIENIKLYLQAQNLLTITKYRGFNIETQATGTVLPPLKVITAGVNLTF